MSVSASSESALSTVRRVHFGLLVLSVAALLMVPSYSQLWHDHEEQRASRIERAAIGALDTALITIKNEYETLRDNPSVVRMAAKALEKLSYGPTSEDLTFLHDHLVRWIIDWTGSQEGNSSYRRVGAYLSALITNSPEFEPLQEGHCALIWCAAILRERLVLSNDNRNTLAGVRYTLNPPFDFKDYVYVKCYVKDASVSTDYKLIGQVSADVDGAVGYLRERNVDVMSARELEMFLAFEKSRIARADSVYASREMSFQVPTVGVVLEIGYFFAVFPILALALLTYELMTVRWLGGLSSGGDCSVFEPWAAYLSYKVKGPASVVYRYAYLWLPAAVCIMATTLGWFYAIDPVAGLPGAWHSVLSIANSLAALFCILAVYGIHRQLRRAYKRDESQVAP